MNRYVPVIIAALLLGGCESLAGLGGSIASMVGAGASESIETKKRDISLWKIEKARLVSKIIDRMEREADRLFANEEYTKGIVVLREALIEQEKHQPLWLIQKFIRRTQEE